MTPDLGDGELFGPIEHRQLRLNEGVTPNANDPLSVPPATVGPPSADAGDPSAVTVTELGTPSAFGATCIVPSGWSGWPDYWATPRWGNRHDDLTDTAWAALDLNASVLATMPPYLVGARVGLPTGWLTNPDPDFYGCWEEFAKQLWWDYQLGEAFILCTSRYEDGRGRPARFHVVSPWLVNAELDRDGFRRYRIGEMDVTADIRHIRYQSRTDDAHGHGPLEIGGCRVVAARVLARYASNLAASGGVPPGWLEHPDELTADQATDLQTKWLEARYEAMGLPAVLSGGVTYRTPDVNARDLALVELAQFNESRISVLLGVPPFLLGLPSGGDSMTYSNVSSLFDYHWRAGLRPKAGRVMPDLSQWLLPLGTRLELNRDEYVQPGPLERAQTDAILAGLGAESGEEIRAEDRLSELSRAPVAPVAPEGVLL